MIEIIAEHTEKKRYWLKLDKDFMKSPHIRVIKNMPNGKDYIIFYLSLMLESIETIGHLRFSDLVPYNEEMLSSLTDTNLDIVRSAIKVFSNLGLIEMLDDGTIYLTQVASMTGKESESAERVRRFREHKKQLLLQCNGSVTNCNDNIYKQSTENKEQSINIINNKNINNKNINNTVVVSDEMESSEASNELPKQQRFIKPTIEEISKYCCDRNNNINAEAFYDYYESNGWKIGKNPMKNWQSAIRNWERNQRKGDNDYGKNITNNDKYSNINFEANRGKVPTGEINDNGLI